MEESGRIFYAKPSITDLEIRYASDAAASGWGEECYAYIHRFEEALKKYSHTRHAVATSSATGAMHLGLAALGIAPEDEIIVPDSTWVASVAPVVHLGAKPVFVDVLPDTWCIDPQAVEKAITPRTKGIIAVHLYGNLCDMSALERIASRHGLWIVEDAAEAIGSGWGATPAGSRGIFGVFSFHGTKTVTTGEGGALVTSDGALADTVRILNNHGRGPDDPQFAPSRLGYKFKISNVAAALGCAQMERLPELLARRREIFFTYAGQLLDIPGMLMNVETPNTTNGYWMPTCILPEGRSDLRQRVLAEFAQAGIDGRIFFPPLSSLPMFAGASLSMHSADLGKRGLNLPCYHDLAEGQQSRVAQIVRRCVEKA